MMSQNQKVFVFHEQVPSQSSRLGFFVVCILAALLCLSDFSFGQCPLNAEQVIWGQNSNDFFGFRSAADEDFVVVTALLADDCVFPSQSGNGTAHIYRGDPQTNQLQLTQILTPGCLKLAGFGVSVAINSPYLAIGQHRVFAGNVNGSYNIESVYLYQFDPVADLWTQQQVVTDIDGNGPTDIGATNGDRFGAAVAIDGTLLIIGAPGDDDAGGNAGSAFIFIRESPSGIWTLKQKLLPPTGSGGFNFGASVDVFEDTIAIGAPNGTGLVPGSGSVYVYRFDSTADLYSLDQLLFEDIQGAIGDQFGSSVSLADQRLAVGAPNISKVFSYLRNSPSDNFSFSQTISQSIAQFGTGVSIVNNSLAISAFSNTTYSGTLSVYDIIFPSEVWQLTSSVSSSLTPSAPNGTQFGRYVGFSAKYLVSGGYRAQETNFAGAGGASAWYRNCDCNVNQVHDSDDISSGFSSDCDFDGTPDECQLATGEESDCNLNGILDSCDLSSASSFDCNANGIPDECEGIVVIDCNLNGMPDECDLGSGEEFDCNSNGVLDSCEIASGSAGDCDGNGILDICDVQGDGTFVDGGQGLGNSSSQFAAIGDLDGDVDLDVVIVNTNGLPNLVYTNDGSGIFTDSGQAFGGGAVSPFPSVTSILTAISIWSLELR